MSVPTSMTNGYTSMLVLIEFITSKATTAVPYGLVGCWTNVPRSVTWTRGSALDDSYRSMALFTVSTAAIRGVG